jgi:hypothetical protein
MYKSKDDTRKQLESDVAMFLTQGKQIVKLPTYGKKTYKIKEEDSVEIVVEDLPEALRRMVK